MSSDPVESLARRAVEASLPFPGASRLIAVDGPAGSGKSTCARALAARLDAGYVATDWFSTWADFDSWWPLFDGFLDDLLHRRAATTRVHAWEQDPTGALWRDHTEAPRGIWVIDGVASVRPETAPLYALTIGFTCPSATRRTRLLAREGAQWAPEIDAWMAKEDRFFAANRVTYDVRVDG